MFDVVPPGMQAMRMRPTAIPGAKPRLTANKNPRKGMMPYWQTTPTRMPLGFLKAIRKSRGVSEAPMPSMITIIMMPSSLVSSSVNMV